jgi:hypothetical protein
MIGKLASGPRLSSIVRSPSFPMMIEPARSRDVGRPRGTIWIIDSDHWPRAYLRAELIERGYDAVGFAAVADALAALALHRRRPDLVVIELEGQRPEAMALDGLFRGIPMLGVAGAAAWETESRRAPAHPWAGLLRRPLTIGEIADAVERQLAARRPGPAARS